MRVRILVLFFVLLVTGAACSSLRTREPLPTLSKIVKDITKEATVPATNPASVQPLEGQAGGPIHYGYTNQRADGNRLVEGRGHLPDAEVIDVSLDGVPRWLVAVPVDGEMASGSTSLWTVVLEDGRVRSFFLKDGVVSEGPSPPTLAESNPPLLHFVDGRPEFLRPPGDAPELAPPAILDESGNWVYIDANGDLVFMLASGVESTRLPMNALPDGRILVDGDRRLLLLTQPTERYGHGVLGDATEAGAVTLIETEPEPTVILTILIPEPLVVEGIAPLWADITGDGSREIILTLSDNEQGAQIVAYDENGVQVAAGPAIGRGHRWRHQLAVAPFGPDGEVELVDVLTPHIGGVVEYYRLVGNELKIVAQAPGYTSHVNGTRNLDMAIAGDFDGDRRIELLLPNQARTELGAIIRTDGGAEVSWTIPLDGKLSTNLAAVTTASGRLILGAGTEDGILRLWS
ncbi:MAG: hypothetical protein WA996_23345 [Candidatus Promineifilaceae bacterium]